MSINAFWHNLGATYYYAAIAPIIFGGLAHFKIWLPSEDDVRRRCQSQREILNEKVNKGLYLIIDKFERSLHASELRGSPPNEPDLIAGHTEETFRVFYVHRALDAIEVTLRRAHTFLYACVAGGVLCILLALPMEKFRPYAAVLAYVILVGQIMAVAVVRCEMTKLRGYENAT